MAEHKEPSKPRRPWRGDVPHVCGVGGVQSWWLGVVGTLHRDGDCVHVIKGCGEKNKSRLEL